MKKSSLVLSVLLAGSLAVTPAVSALAVTRAEVNPGAAAATDVATAAANAGIAGSAALTTYLSGGAVSTEAFLSIDASSLYAIDAAVANEIASYQAVLNTPAPEPTPEPVTPEPGTTDPVTPEPGTTDPAAPATPEDPNSGETTNPDDGDADDPDGNDDADADDASDADKDAATDADKDSDADADKESKDTAEKSDAVEKSEKSEATSEEANTSDSSQSTSASNSSSRTVSANLTTQKFIAVIGEQAREVAQKNGLYASVMIAQAVLESASGNSTLSAAPNYNLFGIKGAYDGNSVVMRTQEDDGSGNYYNISASFRKYDNMRQSLEDYADLLTGNGMGGFYSGALKENTESYKDACEFLQGRYATSTSYASSLEGIIHAYDLTKYDEPLSYSTTDVYEVQATDANGNALYNEDGTPVMEQRTLTDLVTELTSHLGEDYVWGGNSWGGFDCSGLVQYCYRQALGIELPRVSESQSTVGQKVSVTTEDELLESKSISTYGLSSGDAAATLKTQLVEADFDALHMGDLLFWEKDGDAYHVAVYLGEGCFIHAPQTGDVVKVTSLAEYEPDFAMRVVPVTEASADAAEAANGSQVEAAEAKTAATEGAKELAAKTIAAYNEAQKEPSEFE